MWELEAWCLPPDQTRHANYCTSRRFAHLCDLISVATCQHSVNMTHVCFVTCRVSVTDMLVTYPFKCGERYPPESLSKTTINEEKRIFYFILKYLIYNGDYENSIWIELEWFERLFNQRGFLHYLSPCYRRSYWICTVSSLRVNNWYNYFLI